MLIYQFLQINSIQDKKLLLNKHKDANFITRSAILYKNSLNVEGGEESKENTLKNQKVNT